METLPDPIWNVYFGIGGKKIIIAPNEVELQEKAKEFKLSKAATFGRVGKLAHLNIHELFQGKMTPAKKKVFSSTIDFWPTTNWLEVVETGITHPLFLPGSGCFGFINGNLILGNRHHQEIMYRLISEKGWTWDQLIEAKQCWGWFSRNNALGSVRFSSDAGTMTSKKVKNDCIAEFSNWFGVSFKETPGYGGKSKKTYGGDMEWKYGKIGKWGGYRTEEETTIITPLPDPPEEL